MRFKSITAIIVLSLVVASLLVAGCTIGPTSTSSPTPTSTLTPTPTTTAPADLSSYFQKLWEGSGFIVERPFTKSTNARGNDVYTGVMRNTSLSQGSGVTTVEELTKSQSEVKQVYDKAVADKKSEGFIYRADEVARLTADPTKAKLDGLWVGSSGNRWFYVMYYYNPKINSWELTTETA